MKAHKTPSNACVACGYSFDRASSISTNKRPRPDDFTICIKCAAVLRFNADLSTRETLAAELEALDLETYAEIQRVRSAILHMQASKGGTP